MSEARGSILIVDDDRGHRGMVRDVFEGRVGELLTAESGEEALSILGRRRVDLMFLDMRMPGIGGLGTLAAMRREGIAVPTIVLTAFAEVEDAVRAIQLGAIDYLRKPIDIGTLIDLAESVLGGGAAAGAGGQAAEAFPPLPAGVVFCSPLMRQLLAELARVARSDVPVLLCGETGTGKEVLARLVHDWGRRPDGPLVPINVTALPESLVESELFGHAKGAFTGADREQKGLIAEAEGGTLFLDEIGEMPAAVQPKLLRVLESGVLTRLGDGRERRVDFRLVSASNRDLEAEIEAGRFRSDLYYRVAVVTVEVPPLRERPEDIPVLARAFLRERDGGASRRLSPGAEARLGEHSWPGNIRELKNAMQRAAVLAPGDFVLPEHLPPTLRGGERVAGGMASGDPRSLAEIEKQAILRALERCDGNRTLAARELGISRRKLLYRLKEYGG